MNPPKRPRILVVDDDAPALFLLCAFLKRQGYDAVAAVSAEQALQRIGPGFDGALVDVELPGMAGPALCAALRLKCASACGWIFLMSGHNPNYYTHAKECAAADGLLCKPFDPERLSAAFLGAGRPS